MLATIRETGYTPVPSVRGSGLTCDLEGTLGRVSDGRRDSHWGGLALLQGARLAQGDGLFQLPNLG